MKMRNKYYLFLASVSFILLLTHCRKENALNSSSVFSIPMDASSNIVIPYYTLDNTGRYLYIFIRDLSFNGASVLKVNLTSLNVDKQLYFDGSTVNSTAPIMFDNIVVTDDNSLLCSFHNFYYAKQLNMKLDADLNILKVDTTADSYGGNWGRTKMVKNGPGKVAGLVSNSGSRDNTAGNKGAFLRYQNMDENMNILNQVTDTSPYYGNGPILVSSFIKTSDGNFIMCANDAGNRSGLLVEKRDLKFNLLWRTRIGSGNQPVTMNESNGKYYIICHGNNQIYTMVFDKFGSAVDTIVYSIPGAILKKNFEPMRLTENGEFLMPLRIVYDHEPWSQKGVLLHLDGNAQMISHQQFCKDKMYGACLLKINSGKYLLFYSDGNFSGLPRLVFRYVDAKGNFID